MDLGTIVLIFTAAGAVIGGIIGAAMWLVKANKVRKHFNVAKGMTYEEIISALGEPLFKKQKDEKLICHWKITLEGKLCLVGATFINNIAKSIG